MSVNSDSNINISTLSAVIIKLQPIMSETFRILLQQNFYSANCLVRYQYKVKLSKGQANHFDINSQLFLVKFAAEIFTHIHNTLRMSTKTQQNTNIFSRTCITKQTCACLTSFVTAEIPGYYDVHSCYWKIHQFQRLKLLSLAQITYMQLYPSVLYASIKIK